MPTQPVSLDKCHPGFPFVQLKKNNAGVQDGPPVGELPPCRQFISRCLVEPQLFSSVTSV